jgi:hypothetical protein
MATYLPNVNKYVSKTEAFTPDFKFLSDALGRRQDRYDTNYKKMNNLYGSVIHADLSREDNIGIRDTYAEELAPKLQQISGVDFSLQQNVDSAKALFTPFFEDSKIVRDVVFTKRFQSEQNKFQAWKNSEDEETRKKYWDGGVQMLNYSMADFQKASREGSMDIQLPESVEKVNLVQAGINSLIELGMERSDVSLSKDGNYQIKQKNGVALTRKMVGVDEDGNNIYENPAQEYILQTTLDDPRVQRYYQTEFYVKARQFYEENAEKYGGEDAAKQVFYDQMLSDYSIKHTNEEPKKATELSSALEAKNNWEAYKLKHGEPVVGSEEHKRYAQAYNEYIAIANGRKLYDKSHSVITRDAENIDDLASKAQLAYMQYNIHADTKAAAKFYSEINSERTVEADKFALQNSQSLLNQREEEQKAANRRMQTMLEKGYVMDNKGNLMPMPWAEGGSSQSSNQEQIFGPEGGQMDVVAGSGEETGGAAEEGEVDVLQQNSTSSQQKINEIKDLRWNSIEKYYQIKAEDISDDDNPYFVDGMKVDGTLMTWAEAKDYYLDPKNKAKFKVEYEKIKSIYKGITAGPSLEKDNPDLYNLIHKNETMIEGESVKLLAGWEKQTEAYQNVINLMAADGTLDSYQLKLLQAYPLMNSRGIVRDPAEIVGEMSNDFVQWYDESVSTQQIPPTRPGVSNTELRAQHSEIANQFGFKDVDALYDRIYPRDITYGGNPRAKSSKERSRNATNITRVSEMHFKNMYDEFVGKDDAQSLFDDVKEKMNTRMQGADAIPGIQNFNMASFLSGQDQGGVGATIYNYHDSEYVSGQVNVKANEQLNVIHNLLKEPKQNYTVLPGNKSGAYEAVTDPGARLVLDEIFKNLRVKDLKTFPSGAEPNFTVRWSESLGGQPGEGKHSGWVISLSEAYASKIKSTAEKFNNNIVLTLPENSITVFTSKEAGVNNPNSAKNTYVSKTEFLVNMNKKRIIENDGGKVVFYRNSDGQMLVKESVGVYSKDFNGGGIVYSPYSDPVILPPSGYLIDKIFEEYDNRANSRIKLNTDASNAHKAEQNNNPQK